MELVTTLIGREVAAAALDEDKKLIQNRAALDRRLFFESKEAGEALSTNKYLRGVFEAVPVSETGDVAIELGARESARRLRIALIGWGAIATKRDQGVHALTLSTDIDVRKAEAQKMLDACAAILELPIEDISVLASEQLKKKAAAKAAKKEAQPSLLPEATGTPIPAEPVGTPIAPE